jgi:hypothetical protein
MKGRPLWLYSEGHDDDETATEDLADVKLPLWWNDYQCVRRQ